MLDIKQIESFYPEYLRAFKKNLLREYLQYKILEAIFTSDYGRYLIFMGGTAAHIVYGNTRFSEDLDFDNRGLDQKGFKALFEFIKKKVALEGYKVDGKIVFKQAFSFYIKIPELLYDYGLSPHKKEIVLIKIDTEPQNFIYDPNKIIVNKFDVFSRISVVPQDILLAQKICAILKRKRSMGRDFYDAIYMFGKTRPHRGYLNEKLHISNGLELKKIILKKCSELNFKQLANEVEPFLFNPSDSRKVLSFPDYVKELEFNPK